MKKRNKLNKHNPVLSFSMLLFGYRRLYLRDSATIVSWLLRRSVPVSVGPDGSVYVRQRDFSKYSSVLTAHAELVSPPVGVSAYLCRFIAHPGLLLGIALSLALCILSSSFVWQVRIVDGDGIDTEGLLSDLEAAGLSVGERWSDIDRAGIEARLLAISDDVGWITFERRGLVAEIKARPKVSVPEDAEPLYSNIVADRDCIIEQISVRRGVACVSVGQTVSKGQILISGVMEVNGTTVLCNAEGVVTGRVVDDMTEEVLRREQTVSRELLGTVAKDIKFFNFRINIFKKSRNSHDGCDIIEENTTVALFGRYPLPIRITRYIAYCDRIDTVEHTDTELVRIAADRLTARRAELLREADTLQISSRGELTADGYRLTSQIVYITSVGRETPIYTEEVR